jgi:two-component system KDP operon response regulator KdpE
MTSAARILVVEDEAPIAAFVRTLLEAHGYDVDVAVDLREALVAVTTKAPDAVLLDLGLPDGDGVELVRRMRAWSTIPVIVVSARGREGDKVDALDAGADDYLTKPFGAGELLARVRVALRHRAREGTAGPEPRFVVGPLDVDLARREVRVNGVEVALTPIEYKLLETLVQHAGKVLTHAQILRLVWGPAYLRHTHYVRVHVHALRKKIEEDPNAPRLLVTETGVGYRLRDEVRP